MDYKTFKTKSHARAEITKMSGWNAHPTQLELPDPDDPQELKLTWVIECDGDKYLRDDGFIR